MWKDVLDNVDPEKRRDIRFIQKSIKSNYSYMGLPLITYIIDDAVYLGLAAPAALPPYYDNSDKSLLFISNNLRMFDLLSRYGYRGTVYSMIKAHYYKASDYDEFAALQKGVLKQFVTERQIKFAKEVFKWPTRGGKRANSGRKKIGVRRKQNITVSLTYKEKSMITEYTKKNKLCLSTFARDVILKEISPS